ncbi:MAG: ABC transporter permease [Acidobacteria bacterium]|nr:ABC transporter permease [Acidobacteriota bacterium]
MDPVTRKDTWISQSRKNRIAKWGLRVASFLVFLAVWQWYGAKPEMFAVAPPSQVFPAFYEAMLSGELPKAAAGTLYTMAVGYLLAVVVGIVVGFGIAVSVWARNTIEPIVNAAYSAPMALLIPILGVYIGLEFQGRLFLVMVWAVFVIIVNTAAGVRETPPSLMEMAQSFGLNPWSIYRKVIFPSALPYILVGLRLGAGRALRGAVTAEILMSTTNLGKFLIDAGSTFNMPKLLAGIMLVILLGLVIIQGAEYLEQRILSWRRV